MNQFSAFGLPSFIINSLDRMKISTPTPIQQKAIPIAMLGKDLLASAQTGTGKTIAYLLPVIAKLNDCAHGTALILAPTRELADQIKNALLDLIGKNNHRDIALLIGGAPIYKQFMALKKHPRFIIGTPGRIIDHLERKTLSLAQTRFLILDETDRMLDMGFSEDLEIIAKMLPKERQTLMFSATMPNNIIKISQKYLQTPEHVAIGEVTKAAAKIEQKILKTTGKEKFPALLDELEKREGSVIIFVRTKISAAELADRLKRHDHFACAIHGDLKQRQRDEVIRNFRNQKNRIMVATDIAARGLDIPHIMHVINYDLPQCPEDYIHRIGRTGRAGMEGFALSFVSPAENRKWQAIYQHVNHGNTSTEPTKGGRKPRSGGVEKPYRKQRRFEGKPFEGKGKRKEGEKRSQDKKPMKAGDQNRSQKRSHHKKRRSEQQPMKSWQ
ncbi:MAG: DEAD/DEAH box helicase [Proteobacteria bacterium]|nr:DEAD/DEAH box helicase [Pseudomonadota bacterium]